MSGPSDCIFCEPDEPCVTHAPKSKPQKKAKPTGSVLTAPVPYTGPSSSSDDDSDWFGKEPVTESRFAARATEATTLTTDDLELREALRNLEPIMSFAAKAEYKDLMYPPLDSRLARQRSEIRRKLDGVVEGPSAGGS